jgi:hypothetical protein
MSAAVNIFAGVYLHVHQMNIITMSYKRCQGKQYTIIIVVIIIRYHLYAGPCLYGVYTYIVAVIFSYNSWHM